MLGKSHIKVALGATLFTLNPATMLGAFIGSLFPDIDIKSSYLGQFNILLKIPVTKKLFHHRGFTHSILGVSLFSYMIYLISNQAFFIGFLVGILSHIVADLVTGGVDLFWLPFYKSKFVKIAKIKSGSTTEHIIASSILLSGAIITLENVYTSSSIAAIISQYVHF